MKTKIVMAAFIDTWTFVYFVDIEKKACCLAKVVEYAGWKAVRQPVTLPSAT